MDVAVLRLHALVEVFAARSVCAVFRWRRSSTCLFRFLFELLTEDQKLVSQKSRGSSKFYYLSSRCKAFIVQPQSREAVFFLATSRDAKVGWT